MSVVLDSNNPEIVMKPPFIWKVFKITNIEVISNGDTNNISIYYRYSQDYGRTVTEWEPFTKENITTTRITPIRFFQIEYYIKYFGTSSSTLFDINLIGDFQNVTLDYSKTNLYGVRENCNCLILGITRNSADADSIAPDSNMLMPTPPSGNLPQLTDSQKNNLFKPYQLTAAVDLLNKMSNDANDIFGHDVVYFLTDPDKRGIDYSFHEYQLYNYVCNEDIKVSVDNNQFPENSGAINQFDLSLFDSFEIHITKEVFKEAFGVDKRPSREDFLWMCEINRMFTVEHAQPYRGFNNNAIYYKVMLKKYVQKSNIIGANQTITDRVKELTKNSTINELFGLENTQDKLAVANKEQLRPLTHDSLRVDVISNIQKELIQNAEIIISKNNYDLSSVDYGQDAVIYRNMKNYWKISDNVGFISWFSINSFIVNDSYSLFTYYDTVNSIGMSMSLCNNNINVGLNNNIYSLPLTDSVEEDTWYAYVLNINQRQRIVTQYLYKRDVDFEDDAEYLSSTKLRLVYTISQEMIPVEFYLESNIDAKILASDMKLTNIRLFTDIIPEDQHTKILNQSIIRDDSKYLVFADNANQRLVLPNEPTSQLGPGDVGY